MQHPGFLDVFGGIGTIQYRDTDGIVNHEKTIPSKEVILIEKHIRITGKLCANRHKTEACFLYTGDPQERKAVSLDASGHSAHLCLLLFADERHCDRFRRL